MKFCDSNYFSHPQETLIGFSEVSLRLVIDNITSGVQKFDLFTTWFATVSEIVKEVYEKDEDSQIVQNFAVFLAKICDTEGEIGQGLLRQSTDHGRVEGEEVKLENGSMVNISKLTSEPILEISKFPTLSDLTLRILCFIADLTKPKVDHQLTLSKPLQTYL